MNHQAIVSSSPLIYGIKVHMKSGIILSGFVRQGGDCDGLWLMMSRTDDMESATYINRLEVSHFELAEHPTSTGQ